MPGEEILEFVQGCDVPAACRLKNTAAISPDAGDQLRAEAIHGPLVSRAGVFSA